MRSLASVVCVFGLVACATTAPAADVTTAPVIAAERAFAARAAEVGWVQAFRAFVAPDGVLLSSAPVKAPERLAQLTDTGDRTLAWWPAYAGIARSGDIGFTTGPVLSGDETEVALHYFTVWRRQRDGAWKWIFDGGVRVADPAPLSRTQHDIPTLAVATGGAGSSQAAIAQVVELERTHPTAAAALPLLGETVRINRPGLAPGIGRSGAAAMLASPARDITYAPFSAQGSLAGDLVVTINEARWTSEGVARLGYTVRVWQWQDGVWRIVFDELAPVRPRPP